MSSFRSSRWHGGTVGLQPVKPRATRWRSDDLSGPLPTRVMQNLVTAIQSLPVRGPWPETDEEAWWEAVLTDWRTRPSNAKKLPNKDAALRLDRQPGEALTFSCEHCGQSATFTVAELCQNYGPDRNVRTVGVEVIKCKDKRVRREGYDCPISYRG